MTELSPTQVLGLQLEAETAIKLVEAGLHEVAKLDSATDHVHLHMLLLASGFERLLKLTVALHQYASVGQLPTSAEMKNRFSHNVRKLTDEVVQLASADDRLMARPACMDDLDFLRSNPDVTSLVDALTVFAREGRYHDLELFLDGQQRDHADPKRAWDAIETSILDRYPKWKRRLGHADFSGFYKVVARELTYVTDRYVQAVVRIWTLGSLGRPAQMMLGAIKPFLFLRQKELGRLRE